MSIPFRTIGKDGPQVPAVGLGLMSIGGIYGSAGTLEDKFALLDHAYATGQLFWDTADIYADSEDIVGEWFQRSGKRNDIFLASKFGLIMDPVTRRATIRSDPEYAKTACDKSLQRLKVDVIDLYYCHRVDERTPIEKTVQAMVELKNEGKIRNIGLSEVSAASLRRAYAVHPIAALQMEYSPFALDIEKNELLQTCRELGVTVVAYSPIGRGLLTGQIQRYEDFDENDWRRYLPKYAPDHFPKILELVDGLKKVAQAHGSTPSQISIAWLLAQGSDIIPIPGTRSSDRMEENTKSALIQLTDEEVKHIRSLVERTEVQGDRYLAAMGVNVVADTPPL
ncbi:NADP-dependent oxidoreductase domain-containing protein [Penicillium odoratum]|uniref:NADP-dependent oxidoreductase domain-containing protein n=1 Tax=Penicillium odoratum TaxID=1167516 RepID=UPI002548A182|nr:NADP-dependent oxidoreductase domain-containing protein [Penicillium odoratum]KAJ5778324.1 NADP-dependent oxidoreductase domain-containing protein [Penicillium odoratum]